MMAGNARYRSADDIPRSVPVFPLAGALLLPRLQLPLNIFEARYLSMVDAALRADRVIGMVQPRFDDPVNAQSERPELCRIGCLGRLTSFQETGDGRYLITLTGVCRFEIAEEVSATMPYRLCTIDVSAFVHDFITQEDEDAVDREAVLKAFRDYLAANDLEADWPSVEKASNEALVNTLSMMSSYGPAEKQALLEAATLQTRAETLVAITELDLARRSSSDRPTFN